MELDIIDGLKLRGVAASTFNLTDNPTHVNTMTFYQAGSYGKLADSVSVYKFVSNLIRLLLCVCRRFYYSPDKLASSVPYF